MGRRALRGAILVGIASVVPACAEDDSGLEQRLVTGEYTLEAGEERYLCFTFRSPAERTVAITDVRATSGLGEHHVALFQTAPEEMDGSFECPDLVRLNWQPIWAGGTGSPGLTMPENVGFKILPSTQYLVQLHLQNASDAPIIDHSEIVLTYAPEDQTDDITAAGIYALGTFQLEIPAGAVDYSRSTECVADRDLNVFAAFPHMHKIGTKIEFFHGETADDAASIYSLDPWPFDDQPMDPVDWSIREGDFMRATCHWDNPGSEAVTFGESSDDEMCFFVMFYYPFNALAGCIEGM